MAGNKLILRPDHQQLLKRFLRGHPVGVVGWIPQAGKSFMGIHHGREDGAQAILPIEPFNEPFLGLFNGQAANRSEE